MNTYLCFFCEFSCNLQIVKVEGEVVFRIGGVIMYQLFESLINSKRDTRNRTGERVCLFKYSKLKTNKITIVK